ncbi:MFS transporter [Yersinia intermedia]|uniref:MFS transporter n=1 Tax=Yersinia intermedia TaxID=631 RepID=UPI0005DCBBBC|nr:MFS transporter [Yersinia intermedia]CND47924.1 putative membrane transport protein [Yersinia intermedia]
MLLHYKNKVAFIYLFVFFIDLVNIFITVIAFPQLGQDLNADISQLAWVSNIYALGLALILPVSGWLSGRFGTRKVFVTALFLFLMATIMCGLSHSILQLIFWRLLQGIGGGLLIPIGQTMTYREFTAIERAKLTAKILVVASLAPAISPLIGGLIVEYLNWRWIFFFNVPLTLMTLTFAILWLKKEKRYVDPSKKFDIVGLTLISSSLFLILFGFFHFKSMDDFTSTLVILTVAFVGLSLFTVYSLNISQPLLNLRIIKKTLFRKAMVIYFFVLGVFSGVNVLNVYFFQSVLGVSASKTGMIMISYALSLFISISLTGQFFNRCGPRKIYIPGFMLMVLGLLFLSSITSAKQYSIGVISFFLIGFGSSMCAVSSQIMAFIPIENKDMGDASTLWNLNRQLCLSVGVGFFIMLLKVKTSQYGVVELDSAQHKEEIITIFQTCFRMAALLVSIPFILALTLDNQSILNKLHE